MSDMEQSRIKTHRGKAGPRGRGASSWGPSKEVRQPRIGRALSAALSAAAVVAVAVAAVVLATAGHARTGAPPLATSGRGAVPWTDRPAPAYAAPAGSAAPAAHARYAACTASDLAGSVSTTFGLGAGQYTRFLVLKNVSRSACTLSGGPSAIAGMRQSGSRTVLAGQAAAMPDPNLIGPANLRPGQHAQLAITTEVMCQNGAAACARSSYAQVIIGVRGGQVRFAFPSHQPFTLVKGGSLTVSTFGVPGPAAAPVTSPLDALKVSMTAPRTVPADTVENFQVTLHNPTTHAVALAPCPSYAEFVTPLGRKVGIQVRRYFLNCGAAPSIPAGGSVTFAMRLPVPDVTGLAKYGWLLQGTSLEAGGIVSVR
jgi:hypothetical protein